MKKAIVGARCCVLDLYNETIVLDQMKRSVRKSRVGASFTSIITATAIAVACSCLGWLSIAHSFSASISEDHPELSLALNPNNPAALIAAAEKIMYGEQRASDEMRESSEQRVRRIARASDAAKSLTDQGFRYPIVKPSLVETDRLEIRRLAERALSNSPINAPSYRIIALIEPSDDNTYVLMRKAISQSLRDNIAVMWMIQYEYMHRNFVGALEYCDIVLRTAPELTDFIVPTMARLAEKPGALTQIQYLLRNNPPWRERFFKTLIMSLVNQHLPLALLLNMREHGIDPLPKSEINPYLNSLLRGGNAYLAHEAWKKLMPSDPDQTGELLFNSRLLRVPSGAPFDWVINSVKGATVDVVERDDRRDQRTIQVSFNSGFVDPILAQQTLMLSPGTYEFHAQYISSADIRRGVSWIVACGAGNSISYLAKTNPAFGSQPTWRKLSMNFVVPQFDCVPQTLQLRLNYVSDSDRLASGDLWFADFGIRRRE